MFRHGSREVIRRAQYMHDVCTAISHTLCPTGGMGRDMMQWGGTGQGRDMRRWGGTVGGVRTAISCSSTTILLRAEAKSTVTLSYCLLVADTYGIFQS